MICPRCSVGEISETTQECLVCGFSPTGGVMVDSADWNLLDDPVITALERQFQVEGVLRRGSAARIYLARDQVGGRLCSLKVLPLAPFTSTNIIERFRHDAQRAANLDHPHLVAVDRFGVTETALWYAMEYVQGRSLGDLLPTADRMDLKTCLRLVEQVSSALEYGHRRGMVHGNLKPSNVLVDPEGWARVADFGVNGAFGSLPRRQPEVSYEENYGHVAPEQFGAHGEVTPASDQYALAVLVFTCLARRLPFGGDTLEEITLQHLEGPVPLLAETRPELPDYVSPTLARAMSRNPADRFASVLDFATALAGVELPKPAAIAEAPAPEPVEASHQAELPLSAVPAVEDIAEVPELESAADAAPPVAEPEEETEEEKKPKPEPAGEPQSQVEAKPEAGKPVEAEAKAEEAEAGAPAEARAKAEKAEAEAPAEAEAKAEKAGAEAPAETEAPAEAKAPAETAPAHPPLLFVDRGAGRQEDEEDDEDLAEEKEEERVASASEPVEAKQEETAHKPDRKSREPVLLWRASREHPAPTGAAAMASGAGDGESPDAAPPLLFMEKGGSPHRKAWEILAMRGLARFDELAVRWRSLPRKLRIGSGAGAGVIVLLLAVVWWSVARGHEERRPELVAQPPSVAATPDTTTSTPPPAARRATTPPAHPAPHNAAPAAANQPTGPRTAPAVTTPGSTATPTPAAASATEPVHLYLNSTPWGFVYVDDKQIGHTPMDTLIAPGYHVIRVTRDGFLPFEREVAIESGEVLRLTDIVLQEKPQ